jgi:hypothetical protein
MLKAVFTALQPVTAGPKTGQNIGQSYSLPRPFEGHITIKVEAFGEGQFSTKRRQTVGSQP